MDAKNPPQGVIIASEFTAELEAACVRALSAGAISSTFVEQLLKIGRPITDSPADGSIGHHENIRGGDYYH